MTDNTPFTQGKRIYPRAIIVFGYVSTVLAILYDTLFIEYGSGLYWVFLAISVQLFIMTTYSFLRPHISITNKGIKIIILGLFFGKCVFLSWDDIDIVNVSHTSGISVTSSSGKKYHLQTLELTKREKSNLTNDLVSFLGNRVEIVKNGKEPNGD
jgi:hypothetical protein